MFFLDAISDDKGEIRNDQLPGAGDAALSPGHGECSELLHPGSDMHGYPSGNLLAIGQSDVAVCLVQVSTGLFGPLNHRGLRPAFLSRRTTSSWPTTWPLR